MIKSQNHQVIRPVGKPLTEEEKKQRVFQFVQQKREAFALTIMGGFCSNPELFRQEVDPKTLAGFAVKTADALFEELYPIPETENTNK